MGREQGLHANQLIHDGQEQQGFGIGCEMTAMLPILKYPSITTSTLERVLMTTFFPKHLPIVLWTRHLTTTHEEAKWLSALAIPYSSTHFWSYSAKTMPLMKCFE